MIVDLILLALLVLLTRLPFVSRLLYHWDSAQFALALDNYNVSLHQPHPPGYLLYVGLAKLFTFIIPDANAAYVAISIIFSAGAVVFLYLLGRAMFDRTSGLLAGALFVFSPLFWGYGEVACAYTAEAFFSILTAYLCWLVWRSAKKNSEGQDVRGIKAFPTINTLKCWSLTGQEILLTFFLGLAGGFRQGLVIFLLPLWLVTLGKSGWRKVLTGLMVLALVCSIWFIPQAYLSGGQKAYLGESLAQWSQIIWAFSFFNYGWEGLKINLLIFFSYTLFALGFALIPSLGFAWFSLRNRTKLKNKKVWFVLFWVGPAVIFYLLVHMRQPGYVLTYLPAIYLAAGFFLAWLGKFIEQPWRNIILAATVFLLSCGNFYLFVGWPAIPSSSGFISRQEKILEAKFDYTLKHFRPEDTVILGGDHFRHVMYYLPRYQVLWLGPLHRKPEEMNFYQRVISGQDRSFKFLWPPTGRSPGGASDAQIALSMAQETKNVLFFDEKMAPYFVGGAWQKVELDPGTLYVLASPQAGRFVISYHRLEYRP